MQDGWKDIHVDKNISRSSLKAESKEVLMTEELI